MQSIAKEAYETFRHTRDGQLCDAMVDRAALEAVYSEGKRSGEPVLMAYAESVTAVADIPLPEDGKEPGVYAAEHGALRKPEYRAAFYGSSFGDFCYLRISGGNLL